MHPLFSNRRPVSWISRIRWRHTLHCIQHASHAWRIIGFFLASELAVCVSWTLAAYASNVHDMWWYMIWYVMIHDMIWHMYAACLALPVPHVTGSQTASNTSAVKSQQATQQADAGPNQTQRWTHRWHARTCLPALSTLFVHVMYTAKRVSRITVYCCQVKEASNQMLQNLSWCRRHALHRRFQYIVSLQNW